MEGHTSLTSSGGPPKASSRRLTRKADFQRLAKGRSWANRLLVLKVAPNLLQVSRYGLAVGKATGGAVSRNRTKRRLREIMRQQSVIPGWDILLIARTPIAESSYSEIQAAAGQLLRQAKLVQADVEKTIP
ncbi:MAG: ribonuclease P protein component [Chloroflexi bacterium]|nr:ribonuclease P protein component [Chloroflexota bacterium]